MPETTEPTVDEMLANVRALSEWFKPWLNGIAALERIAAHAEGVSALLTTKTQALEAASARLVEVERSLAIQEPKLLEATTKTRDALALCRRQVKEAEEATQQAIAAERTRLEGGVRAVQDEAQAEIDRITSIRDTALQEAEKARATSEGLTADIQAARKELERLRGDAARRLAEMAR